MFINLVGVTLNKLSNDKSFGKYNIPEYYKDDFVKIIENSRDKFLYILVCPYVEYAKSIKDFSYEIYEKYENDNLESLCLRKPVFSVNQGNSEFISSLRSQKFYKDEEYPRKRFQRSHVKLVKSPLDFVPGFTPKLGRSGMKHDITHDFLGADSINNLVPLRENTNIIVEGVAGSGKSYLLKKLRESNFYGENGNRIEVVVFHPSTSYEEFVSGIRPNFGKESGEGDFVTQEGTFIQMCNRAAEDPDNPYLLFIDEINRANTSRVFGDLMLVLEKSKRQDFKDLSVENRDGALFEAGFQQMPGEYVRLQTPIFKNGKEYNKLAVPSNLHVLGTMNTTDRSVGTIDLALRRRFHWITQHPYTAEELKEAMMQANETYPDSIASWYENANNILLEKVGPDARLGHAYFFGKEGDEEAIAEALLNQLKEVAFTFNISQSILNEIGMVGGKRIIIRGSGLGARPDIVAEPN